MDRRALLKVLAGTTFIGPLSALALTPTAESLTSADEDFLDDMERRGCLFFAEQASPRTSQVLDRARWVNSNEALDSRRMASIAATGFGLSALCIAAKRGYQPTAHVLEQVRRTL